MQNEWKRKDSKETVWAYLLKITKKNHPEKFGSTWEQNMLGSSKKFATEMKDKLTLHLVKCKRCICWTYITTLKKCSLPLHGRLWIQVHSQIAGFGWNLAHTYWRWLKNYMQKFKNLRSLDSRLCDWKQNSSSFSRNLCFSVWPIFFLSRAFTVKVIRFGWSSNLIEGAV